MASDRPDRRMNDDYDQGNDRNYEDGGKRRFVSSGFTKRKNCRFCTDEEYVLDYKNVRVIQSFLTEHGKIVPRRISGNCALHQRRLTSAVKRARNLALVGFTSVGL